MAELACIVSESVCIEFHGVISVKMLAIILFPHKVEEVSVLALYSLYTLSSSSTLARCCTSLWFDPCKRKTLVALCNVFGLSISSKVSTEIKISTCLDSILCFTTDIRLPHTVQKESYGISFFLYTLSFGAMAKNWKARASRKTFSSVTHLKYYIESRTRAVLFWSGPQTISSWKQREYFFNSFHSRWT